MPVAEADATLLGTTATRKLSVHPYQLLHNTGKRYQQAPTIIICPFSCHVAFWSFRERMSAAQQQQQQQRQSSAANVSAPPTYFEQQRQELVREIALVRGPIFLHVISFASGVVV